LVPVSQARNRLTELLNEARENDVYLLKHGKPVGVLLSIDRYEAMQDIIEEVDCVAAARAADAEESVPFNRDEYARAGWASKPLLAPTGARLVPSSSRAWPTLAWPRRLCLIASAT